MGADVKLIWVTPDAEKHILYMARVSSNNQESSDTRLLKYLVNHKHWSPFEMVNMCVEINTSRAISAQILRHRSFSFQEFSQRYAETQEIVKYPARRQDHKNRQNSINDVSLITQQWFSEAQDYINNKSMAVYRLALEKGIAKECARFLLPMSSKTKLYMNGNIRSWIHYLSLRCDPATQLEHREIAYAIRDIFIKQFPIISEGLYNK